MTTYGYARYSGSGTAAAENYDSVMAEFAERGCVETFVEIATTSPAMPGPEFKKLVDKVQSGDTVLFPAGHRISRDLRRLSFVVYTLWDLGVDVEFLHDPETLEKLRLYRGILIDGTGRDE